MNKIESADYRDIGDNSGYLIIRLTDDAHYEVETSTVIKEITVYNLSNQDIDLLLGAIAKERNKRNEEKETEGTCPCGCGRVVADGLYSSECAEYLKRTQGH